MVSNSAEESQHLINHDHFSGHEIYAVVAKMIKAWENTFLDTETNYIQLRSLYLFLFCEWFIESNLIIMISRQIIDRVPIYTTKLHNIVSKHFFIWINVSIWLRKGTCWIDAAVRAVILPDGLEINSQLVPPTWGFGFYVGPRALDFPITMLSYL